MTTISTANKASASASNKRVTAQPKYWGRRLALILIITIGLAISVIGTSYAYYTLQTTIATNPFNARDVQLVILENYQVVSDQTLEIPLGTDTKLIEIMNPADAADAVVRVTFAPELVAGESSVEQTLYEFFDSGSISAPIDNMIDMGGITLHFAPNWDDADNGWFFQDGFFYYNRILEANQITPPLLIGVTTTLTDAQIQVVVSAEALQAYPDEAVDVWGVSIS